MKKSSWSRREFLQFFGANLAALSLPSRLWSNLSPGLVDFQSTDWPLLKPDALPLRLQSILERIPPVSVDPSGRLLLHDTDGASLGPVPQLRTQWNLERSSRFERLDMTLPWGIVLHWFGDLPEYELSVAGYMRGFDGVRPAGDTAGRTSAHFLVGGSSSSPYVRPEARYFGILQTQAPDTDGVPYAASHLEGLFSHAILADSYFAQAFDHLRRDGLGVPCLMNSPAASRSTDWNYQTIAVEMTGSFYESEGRWPGEQQIANLVGLIAALMLRYRIPAIDVYGHLEMDPRKSDPGKVFLALMRTLLGAYALVSPDQQLKALTFGPFLEIAASPAEAVLAYFRFLRDYAIIIARPDQVFAWETLSGYWLLVYQLQVLAGLVNQPPALMTAPLLSPLSHNSATPGDHFLIPAYHEGVDIFPASLIAVNESMPVQLIAPGECLFAGPAPGYCPGAAALFRHTQPDGAQVISVYAHLALIADLVPGRIYQPGSPVGLILRPTDYQSAYLHFAVAYGAGWDHELSQHPTPLPGANPQRLLTRYIDPLAYLSRPLPIPAPAPSPEENPAPKYS